MATEKTVEIDLGDDGKFLVVAEAIGPQLVADDDIVARLEALTKPIGRVGREVLDAAKSAKPSKATVELAFGLALEQGQLVALFGKARGEATVKVVLEWSQSDGG